MRTPNLSQSENIGGPSRQPLLATPQATILDRLVANAELHPDDLEVMAGAYDQQGLARPGTAIGASWRELAARLYALAADLRGQQQPPRTSVEWLTLAQAHCDAIVALCSVATPKTAAQLLEHVAMKAVEQKLALAKHAAGFAPIDTHHAGSHAWMQRLQRKLEEDRRRTPPHGEGAL